MFQRRYLEGQKSASLLIDPEHIISQSLFDTLSLSGFRRSGDMLYKPKCPNCNACISVRIPSKHFKPNKNQKRVWKKNIDITTKIVDISFEKEHFDLYLKYQRARHPRGAAGRGVGRDNTYCAVAAGADAVWGHAGGARRRRGATGGVVRGPPARGFRFGRTHA